MKSGWTGLVRRRMSSYSSPISLKNKGDKSLEELFENEVDIEESVIGTKELELTEEYKSNFPICTIQTSDKALILLRSANFDVKHTITIISRINYIFRKSFKPYAKIELGDTLLDLKIKNITLQELDYLLKEGLYEEKRDDKQD